MKDVTIVVGTIGQSIMRSEDNGQTWARVGPRRGFAYEASVRCIAMHPKQHNILFASTEKGLYRSDDKGANWQYVDSALNGQYVWVIAFDPVNPDNMFVGTGTPMPALLFRSKDGGRSLGEAAGRSGDRVRGRRHAEIYRHRRRSAGAESCLGRSRSRRRASQQRRRRHVEHRGSDRDAVIFTMSP